MFVSTHLLVNICAHAGECLCRWRTASLDARSLLLSPRTPLYMHQPAAHYQQIPLFLTTTISKLGSLIMQLLYLFQGWEDGKSCTYRHADGSAAVTTASSSASSAAAQDRSLIDESVSGDVNAAVATGTDANASASNAVSTSPANDQVADASGAAGPADETTTTKASASVAQADAGSIGQEVAQAQAVAQSSSEGAMAGAAANASIMHGTSSDEVAASNASNATAQ